VEKETQREEKIKENTDLMNREQYTVWVFKYGYIYISFKYHHHPERNFQYYLCFTDKKTKAKS
jgi:hypothetical protein